MAFYKVTITGTKVFLVEADSQEEALDHEVTQDEMTSYIGDVEWEADEAEAKLEIEYGMPDLEAYDRFDIKVFDRDGNEQRP